MPHNYYSDSSISFPDVKNEDVVFDLDGTLLEGDLGETVFYLLLFEKIGAGIKQSALQSNREITLYPDSDHIQEIRIFRKYQTLKEQVELAQAYKLTARVVGSYPLEQVRSMASETLQTNTDPVEITINLHSSTDELSEHSIQVGARLRPKLAEIVKCLKKRGSRMWIVSASPQTVVEACSDLIGISRNRVKGVTTTNNDDQITRFPWMDGKAAVLRENGVVNPLIVFGNGLEDLGMLQIARIPVVVSGANPELIKIARKRKWHVLGKETRLEWE